MERWLAWLAMLQASSATVSHVSGQTNAAGIGIIRQCFMNVPQYLLVKGSNKPSPYTLATCTWLSPAACMKKLLDKREEGLFTSFKFEQLG